MPNVMPGFPIPGSFRAGRRMSKPSTARAQPERTYSLPYLNPRRLVAQKIRCRIAYRPHFRACNMITLLAQESLV
jgi:hypothetical protein